MTHIGHQYQFVLGTVDAGWTGRVVKGFGGGVWNHEEQRIIGRQVYDWLTVVVSVQYMHTAVCHGLSGVPLCVPRDTSTV